LANDLKDSKTADLEKEKANVIADSIDDQEEQKLKENQLN
jgi:hypothetical protein